MQKYHFAQHRSPVQFCARVDPFTNSNLLQIQTCPLQYSIKQVGPKYCKKKKKCT